MKTPLLFVALFVASPRLAATAQSAPVSRELAIAAIRAATNAASMSDPIISTDIPADLKARIVPPDRGRILGAVSYAGNIDIFGTSTATAEAVAQWYATDFQKRGFLPIDPSTIGSWDRGGFRQPPGGSPTVFCSNGDRLHIFSRTGVDRLTHFRIRVTPTGSGDYSCGRPEYDASIPGGTTSWGGTTSPLTFPLLVNPAYATGQCDARSGVTGNTEVQLSTTLSANALLDHYAKQLREQGWSQKESSPAATTLWTRADSAGRPWRAVLSVVPTLGMADCKRATLRLIQER